MPRPRPFLTAQWRNLVMLNYEVEPDSLQPLVPDGTELDLWQDRALISLVGFQFLDTRFHGWPVPFHRHFEEVNLRFYVRRETPVGWRRGVAFIREIVPKFAVSFIANTFYHEHYLTLPMTSRVQLPASTTDRTGRAAYCWHTRNSAFALSADFSGLPQRPGLGTEPEFIVEHYWGYTRRADGVTAEYRVDHPPWRVWQADRASFTGDPAALYGPDFASILRQPPSSALIAEGSPVAMITDYAPPTSPTRKQGPLIHRPSFVHRTSQAPDHSGSGLPLVSGASQITPRPRM